MDDAAYQQITAELQRAHLALVRAEHALARARAGGPVAQRANARAHQAVALHADGKNYEEIARALGYAHRSSARKAVLAELRRRAPG